MTINALAKSLVMDRTTLGRNILPLEREGLIEIVPGNVDRRSKVVHLTEAGATRLHAARAGWTQAQKNFATSFGRGRTTQLRALLHAVTETEFGDAPPAASN
jgi:DNA-binding MarR family transcriptional regulator